MAQVMFRVAGKAAHGKLGEFLTLLGGREVVSEVTPAAKGLGLAFQSDRPMKVTAEVPDERIPMLEAIFGDDVTFVGRVKAAADVKAEV